MMSYLHGINYDVQTLNQNTKVDALRIKRNIGWYIREYCSNKNRTFEEFVNDARALVNHHFNVHNYCNCSWCLAKDLDDMEEEAAKKTIIWCLPTHDSIIEEQSVIGVDDDDNISNMNSVSDSYDVVDEDEPYEEEEGGLDDVDSIHSYNEDNIDEFVDKASYFQDSVPIFNGLTDEEAIKKRANQEASERSL